MSPGILEVKFEKAALCTFNQKKSGFSDASFQTWAFWKSCSMRRLFRGEGKEAIVFKGSLVNLLTTPSNHFDYLSC